MENDTNEEVIIEPQETNEPEINLDETPTEEPETKKPEESLEDKRARLKRQLEQTEKKLGIKPETKVETTAVNGANLSSEDLIAVVKSNINEDDIADVVKYAKYEGISVKEALKSNVVKNILAEKEEQRNVAAATNTGAVRRGSSKPSDDVLLERANKGQVPESPEEMARLWELKYKRKK